MTWIELKVDTVVWVPSDVEDPFEFIARAISERALFVDEVGEYRMTDHPEVSPPKCPVCDVQVEAWTSLVAYNAGDTVNPDWYFCCQSCYAEMT